MWCKQSDIWSMAKIGVYIASKSARFESDCAKAIHLKFFSTLKKREKKKMDAENPVLQRADRVQM